ncbi:Multidrug resistance-associated protein 1 [Entophlyctis luteolus]|nr:Multidrug resistance-associated protein 1 [Entophlyctis luteolus]KAJ3383633.1 Multidrug resistance-associated protein 1 [Entophlyctis sp. JEL0112]
MADESSPQLDAAVSDAETESSPRRPRRFHIAPTKRNLLDLLLMFWAFRLVALVRDAGDVRDLHLHLKGSESAKLAAERLEVAWDSLNNAADDEREPDEDRSDKRTATNPSLWKALYLAFGSAYLSVGVWKLFHTAFYLASCYLLCKTLVVFCENRNSGTNQPAWQGHLLALALLASSLFASVCYHQVQIQSTKIGIRCRASLMVMIYRKSLKLSYVKGGVGDVVNLMANECNRVAEATVNWHFLWSSVFDSIIIVILAFVDVGVGASASALLILIVLLPMQYFIATKTAIISLLTTAHITKRVHLVSEVLTAIKLLKFYAWESYYVEKIMTARVVEMQELRSSLLLRIGSYTLVFIAPSLLMFICVAIFLGFNNATMSASNIFALFSLFYTLRYPLMSLPKSVRTVWAAFSSLHRLEEFLHQPEVDQLELTPPADPNVLMEIQNADFLWDGGLDHPHITNLSLTIHRGEIIAVVGELSSGKSLLAAIMGQIKRKGGQMAVHTTCGYVPQEPWLIDATIRDNILFGHEFVDQKYTDVIRLVGLTRDLMLMSNGDDTRISDVQLSSGQKQRLSLARCIYHDCGIVLVEDALSDFDVATARRIFKECFRNNLSKTRAIVLVTQQKQFLNDCDRILLLKNGRVIENGSYSELKAKKVNFSAWVNDYVPIDDESMGLLERVNEIKLDMQGTVRGHSPLSHMPMKFGADLETRNPLGFRRKAVVHKSSPLVTSEVITSDLELNSIGGGVHLSAEEANEHTIKAIQELNNSSIQNAQINEQTISMMIERNQHSILTGGTTRPPANFSNQDPVARTIEANQLTVHSMVAFEKTMTDRAIVMRADAGPWQSYVFYLNEGNGVVLGSLATFFFISMHALFFTSGQFVCNLVQRLILFSDWLLTHIVDNPGIDYSVAIGVYGILIGVGIVGFVSRGYFFSLGTLRKSKSLHDRALKSIVRAPMSFFDSTPLGQILANFAKHLYLIDDSLPETFFQVLSIAPMILGILILVCAIVPIFIATLPITVGFALFVVYVCHDAEQRLVVLEGDNSQGFVFSHSSETASNKSPMFSHLSTTLEGLFSIRLYNAQESFDSFNRSLIDADHKALYSLNVVKTVQAMYLDFAMSFMVYFAALFIVIRENIPASHAGFALAHVLQLLLFVQWLARLTSNLHQAITSVGAVVQFSNQIPCEAVRHVPSNRGRPFWPEKGAVEFKNVILRYNRYGVAILKGVSFLIAPGEKIGIVGKSGSGKSTILVALLRIAEYTEGDILIDGVDIKTLGVADLRSRIAVIPQDPVLLTGTVRSNLDPFCRRSDEEIWKALRSVHLGAKIEEFPQKLETAVVENGRAFSLAERQLFCVARAVLLNSKIVVFDEPTIAADSETDSLIQSTISENFADATVIILASRFRMIAETDRIMVMRDGKIVEFDTPLALLDNPRSKFSLMLNQAAELDQERLRRNALARAESKKATVAARKVAAAQRKAVERKISFNAKVGGGSKFVVSNSAGRKSFGSEFGAIADVEDAEQDNAASLSSSTSLISASGSGQMPKSLLDLFGGPK